MAYKRKDMWRGKVITYMRGDEIMVTRWEDKFLTNQWEDKTLAYR